MKEFNKEISKDGVKSSPFRGLRGGMIVVFSLAFLYLLFVEKRVAGGNESDNRMVDTEVAIPYTPDSLDNHGKEAVTRIHSTGELNPEAVENPIPFFLFTGISTISISGEHTIPGDYMRIMSKKRLLSCDVNCTVGDKLRVDDTVSSLYGVPSSLQYNIIPLHCVPNSVLLLEGGCRILTNGLSFMGYGK